MHSLIKNLIYKLPGISAYIGYGSACFPQSSYDYTKNKPMIDLFLITEDITDFHIRNLLANPHHYCPAARILGHKYVCAVQNRGNKVYYNPYIQIQDEMFKYGVVQEDDLLIDLHFWKNYFLAGRMQKPILISQLGTKFETKLSKDLDYNRRNALILGLLQAYLSSLSDNSRTNIKFSEEILFEKIVQLSFIGDIRFKLKAENPLKVQNLVKGNFQYLQEIYAPILENLQADYSFKVQKSLNSELIIELSRFEIVIDQLLGELCSIFPEIINSKILRNEKIKLIVDTIHKKNSRNSKYGIISGFLSTSLIHNVNYIYYYIDNLWN